MEPLSPEQKVKALEWLEQISVCFQKTLYFQKTQLLKNNALFVIVCYGLWHVLCANEDNVYKNKHTEKGQLCIKIVTRTNTAGFGGKQGFFRIAL